jgi:hypothetical protein
VFIADYWEIFQGDLQDIMFYMTFIIPGLLYSFALSLTLDTKNVALTNKMLFIGVNSLLWVLLYVFCLKGYIEGYVSERMLQVLIVVCGLIGASVIGVLSRVFLKTEPFPIYYIAAIGLLAVLISQFAIAPLLNQFFSFKDLQISGIVVALWQLGIGLYYWYHLDLKAGTVVSSQ